MVRRSALAVAMLLALLVAFSFYGWRYGFAPLPEPVTGGELRLPPPRSESELTPGNYWYWVREISRTVTVYSRGVVLSDAYLRDWAETGATPAFTNRLARTSWGRAETAAWFGGQPSLPECYRAALATTDAQPVNWMGAEARAVLDAQRRLLQYPGWLASESEQSGRTHEALGHLLDGWRLLTQGPSTQPPVYALLAVCCKAWRRLALEGPGLTEEEGRRSLGELGGLVDRLPALELAFARAAEARQGRPEELADLRQNARVWVADFRTAFAKMTGEMVRFLRWLLERLMGGADPPAPIELRGVRHLAEPAGELSQYLQIRAARRQDFERVRDAYFSQVLSALRRGDLELAERRATALQQHGFTRSWFSRTFDRPAVWSSLADYPKLGTLIESDQLMRACLESCRLTLALRLFRDRRGHWPDRIEELVPDVLAAVPIDPYTRKPFLYERDGDDWLVRSLAENARAPDPADEGVLFGSGEPEMARLVLRMANADGQAGWDIGILRRYGLLPKGEGAKTVRDLVAGQSPLARSLRALTPGLSGLRSLVQYGMRTGEMRLAPATNRTERTNDLHNPSK